MREELSRSWWIAAGYAAGRWVLGALAATIPGGRRRQIAGTAIALVVAGGLQLAAALGEVQLRRDTTYAQAMRREPDRVVARELAEWAEQQARAGEAPTDQARAEMQRNLAQRHAQFPFAIVLAVLTVLAAGAGAVRTRAVPAAPVATALLVRCAVVCGGSIALVIAIDAVFH